MPHERVTAPTSTDARFDRVECCHMHHAVSTHALRGDLWQSRIDHRAWLMELAGFRAALATHICFSIARNFRVVETCMPARRLQSGVKAFVCADRLLAACDTALNCCVRLELNRRG